MLASISSKRNATLITLIRRQETDERTLMNLYPQPRGRQDSVEAFPEAPVVPGLPPGRERPRRRREAPAGVRAQR
jgi:hypothetical protein